MQAHLALSVTGMMNRIWVEALKLIRREQNASLVAFYLSKEVLLLIIVSRPQHELISNWVIELQGQGRRLCWPQPALKGQEGKSHQPFLTQGKEETDSVSVS